MVKRILADKELSQPMEPRAAWTRRRFIAGAIASLTFAAHPGEASADRQRNLIVRSRWPQDFETPDQYLDSYLTANDVFFVRSHFGPPALDPRRWRLEVSGMVKSPRTFTLDEIKKLKTAKAPATLQCAGNGRALFSPKVPGAQWRRGAVGNAMWTGVRLGELLKSLGVAPGALHLQCAGYDAPPTIGTPPFIRSIPLERALHPSTLLAFEMNGKPLPLLHGGPLRLVVPEWAGENWTKWLRGLSLQDHEAQGFWMATAYRMAQAGSAAAPAPVKENIVKSLISRPLNGATITGGTITISGVAFTGAGRIVKVEVSSEPGKWSDARVYPQKAPGAWQQWRLPWTPKRPGRYLIAARATDSNGNEQPDAPAWNKSGYLWNGIERVSCEVRQ